MDPAKIQSEYMWNVFDEKALLAGLERKPGETNVELQNRIADRVDGNSTHEGLSDWALDLFNTDEVYPSGLYPSGIYNDVTEQYVFYSQYLPLSKHQYDQLSNPDMAYSYPVVYDFGTGLTHILAYYDSSLDKSPCGKWWLYKSADLKYSQIWEANYLTEEVELRYQTLINNEIYDVVESPRRPE